MPLFRLDSEKPKRAVRIVGLVLNAQKSYSDFFLSKSSYSAAENRVDRSFELCGNRRKDVFRIATQILCAKIGGLDRCHSQETVDFNQQCEG